MHNLGLLDTWRPYLSLLSAVAYCVFLIGDSVLLMKGMKQQLSQVISRAADCAGVHASMLDIVPAAQAERGMSLCPEGGIWIMVHLYF